MNLEDWLEWTDARGGTLEEHGFLEWFRNEQAKAWDEGESAGEYNAGNGLASLLSGVEPPPPTENPYRTGGAE